MTSKMPACVRSNFLVLAAALAVLDIDLWRRLHADSHSQRLMRHGVTRYADPKTTEAKHEIVAPLASHQISTVADSETKSLDSKFVLHVGPPSK